MCVFLLMCVLPATCRDSLYCTQGLFGFVSLVNVYWSAKFIAIMFTSS